MSVIVAILLRWVHVVAACLALGGVFFMRIVLPAALSGLDEGPRRQTLLRARRVFKRVVHTCILLLLLSGAYNAVANWPRYKLNPPLMHALFGVHVLLALSVFTLAIIVTKGAEPPASHRQMMLTNLVLLLLTVAAASSLKWARDKAVADRMGVPATGATPAARE